MLKVVSAAYSDDPFLGGIRLGEHCRIGRQRIDGILYDAKIVRIEKDGVELHTIDYPAEYSEGVSQTYKYTKTLFVSDKNLEPVDVSSGFEVHLEFTEIPEDRGDPSKKQDDGKRIHYHGGPMWGNVPIGEGKVMSCKEVLYKNACALVSYARMDQLKYVLNTAKSVVFDNGAFKTHNDLMKGKLVNFDPIAHWARYYSTVLSIYSRIDWFIVPDVIDGTEAENDALLNSVPVSLRDKAVPVWHSTESIERLVRMCTEYERVAIGLCGEHWKTMSKVAQARLEEAFRAIYIDNKLDVKIHGLRMLDGRVLGKFPFDSADSSFVAVNVPKLNKQIPEVTCKLARTAIYKNKIESVMPPSVDEWRCNIDR